MSISILNNTKYIFLMLSSLIQNSFKNKSFKGKALKRQVAFLFDFEEIEHTTVLGLTLQDIIKDAKHKLRPWELEKKRKIRGLKKSLIPNLGYSQIYCYYRNNFNHLFLKFANYIFSVLNM